jgi:hypothetical protein
MTLHTRSIQGSGGHFIGASHHVVVTLTGMEIRKMPHTPCIVQAQAVPRSKR